MKNISELKLVVLKLINSEVVMGELNDDYSIKDPLLIETAFTKEGMEYIAKPFLPFSSKESFRFQEEHVMFCEDAAPNSLKFYGSAVSQMKVARVKADVFSKSTGDMTNDYPVIATGLQRIKEISSEYSGKFGIEEIDTSDVEEMLKKYAPKFH